VVVIRGGGARNELATFDAEPIALAIATSPLPVLTGLGHEVDRSVADEVAHTSLKTPTACAGELVDRVASYRDQVEARWSAIGDLAARDLESARTRLADRAHRVARRTHAAVERADERLSTRIGRLIVAPGQQLRHAAGHLGRCADRLGTGASRPLTTEERRLDVAAARLAVLDPVNLLRRGWSISRTADGEVIRSTAQVAPGALITTELADGTLTSRIEDQ
jgi:exodeoxyribonuclease VII large subunit